MKRFLLITAFASLALAFAVPESANAESLLRICTATGNCGICDVATTATTLGQWLITGASGLALVVIVFAAIGLITSAGNTEKIQAAKKQILWAVLGVGLVFAAFYLVMWVIFAFTNPSNQYQYVKDPSTEKTAETGGLSTFLGGTAWWSICNEQDLRDKYDNQNTTPTATADCRFWGDGTPCKNNRQSICFNGACVSVGTAEVQQQISDLGGYPLPQNPSACDYLAAIDRVFENYSCQPTAACNPEKIETGFCGGTQVCCEPTTFTPRVRPATTTPAEAPSAPAGSSASSGDEASVRAQFATAEPKVDINRTNSCPDILTSTGCTSVAGLSQYTIDKIIEANEKCNGCVVITGGTERGPHSKNTTHGRPNVVDLDNSQALRNALDSMGLVRVTAFPDGYNMGSNWYICDTGGQAVSCSTASHLHVEF